MSELSLIPLHQVGYLWHIAEPHIKRAVEQSDGLVTLEDHKDCVLSGARQLWLITNKDKCVAAGITEIIRGVCFIWALGGSGMKDWWRTQEQLEDWALKLGCRGIEFYGREGWVRPLRSRGYEKRLVVLYKELRP